MERDSNYNNFLIVRIFKINGAVVRQTTDAEDAAERSRSETPEELYARTHPVEHRGLSGCCDPPPGLGYGGE